MLYKILHCNCFIMALLMRLRYRYTIFYIDTDHHVPHFVWWNHSIGNYQHYTFDFDCRPKEWYKLLWFKGHIDGLPDEFIKKKKVIKIF